MGGYTICGQFTETWPTGELVIGTDSKATTQCNICQQLSNGINHVPGTDVGYTFWKIHLFAFLPRVRLEDGYHKWEFRNPKVDPWNTESVLSIHIQIFVVCV